MVLQACRRIDISASARSYRCRMSWIIQMQLLCLDV